VGELKSRVTKSGCSACKTPELLSWLVFARESWRILVFKVMLAHVLPVVKATRNITYYGLRQIEVLL
jgi:hypothetical protein